MYLVKNVWLSLRFIFKKKECFIFDYLSADEILRLRLILDNIPHFQQVKLWMSFEINIENIEFIINKTETNIND
jgi:hypothetical protein